MVERDYQRAGNGHLHKPEAGQGHVRQLLPGMVDAAGVGVGHAALRGLVRELGDVRRCAVRGLAGVAHRGVGEGHAGQRAGADDNSDPVLQRAQRDSCSGAGPGHGPRYHGPGQAAEGAQSISGDVHPSRRRSRGRSVHGGRVVRHLRGGMCVRGSAPREASALQVGDVDFLRKGIRVSRQVQWTDDGQMEIRGPKYGSERTVFIPDRLVMMISEHVRVHRPGDDPERWLFPSTQNSSLPAHAATIGRAWRGLRDKVGVEHRLHDLRHFYASGLIAAGCDVVTVQRALGHSSAALTLTTYSHLWPDASDRTRSAAGELLEQALGGAAADGLRTDWPKRASD